jgi:hypothetical protein
MSLTRNEQIKLMANALDRASTACFTVGIATPLAGFLYNVGGFRTLVGPLELAIGVIGWLMACVFLHRGARGILRGLER